MADEQTVREVKAEIERLREAGEITCGCGACVAYKPDACSPYPKHGDWVWNRLLAIASLFAGSGLPRRAFCPTCGSPVGFTDEGEPTVGASYAELDAIVTKAGEINVAFLSNPLRLVICNSGDRVRVVKALNPDDEERAAVLHEAVTLAELEAMIAAVDRVGGTSEQEAGG